MVSRDTAEAAVEEAGLPPDQVETVIAEYEDAQIDALKRALLAAALFALVALWLARDLPGAPLAGAEAPARASPQLQPSAAGS